MTEIQREIRTLVGVRGVAVGVVVTMHLAPFFFLFAPSLEPSFNYLASGILAVDFFFLLSGFILSYKYLDLLAGSERVATLRYLVLRVARIYPVHIVMVFALVAYHHLSIRQWGYGLESDNVDPLNVALNVLMLNEIPPVTTINLPSWSVATEMGAYLAFPLLAVVLVRVRSLRTAFLLALSLLVVGAWLVYGYYERLGLDAANETYVVPWLRIATCFPAGCLVYLGWRQLPEHQRRGPQWDLVALAGIVGTVVTVAVVQDRDTFHAPMVAYPFLALTLLGLAGATGGMAAALGNRVVEWSGRVSYSVYLSHFLVLAVAYGWIVRRGIAAEPRGVRVLVTLGVIALVVAVGAATYYLVEEPSRKAGRNFAHRRWGRTPPPETGSPDSRPVKVAIAHDYLTQRGGAERVVLAMARAFPEAPIYTTLYDPAETFPEYADLDVRTSWLNRIRFFRRNHRFALPLLPLAASGTKIDADVVLVSSSGWAHGFRTDGRKIVYCYTPARWLHQSNRYLGDHPSTGTAMALRLLAPGLRRWDMRAARSATEYLTISSVVQDRVLTAYGRASTVLPAPWPDTVTHESEPMAEVTDWLAGHPYELCVSRLLPYKNVAATVEAYASEPSRRLVVVGRGPEKPELVKAAGDNVLFLENITDGELAWLYRGSTALIAISYEDFGLTPLEAASFGKPCIVLRWGGFVETMVENVTAVFVEQPTASEVRRALQVMDARTWDPDRIREHAERYSDTVFIEAIREVVKRGTP